jgi:hypothetical protein
MLQKQSLNINPNIIGLKLNQVIKEEDQDINHMKHLGVEVFQKEGKGH